MGQRYLRVDAAVAYRFTNYLQGKVQYSFTHDEAKIQVGEQLIAAQLTINSRAQWLYACERRAPWSTGCSTRRTDRLRLRL